MKTYGLTGGIASGKSTVAAMFKTLGIPVVDADIIARFVVEAKQPAFKEIVARFGDDILVSPEIIDRNKLGSLIFSDPQARHDLNKIMHPRISERSKSMLAKLAAQSVSVAIYEAALLVENKLHHALDGLIVVSVPKDIQLARLMIREQLCEKDARARLDSQLPLSEKISVADFVIDNSEDLIATQTQVRSLAKIL